MNKPLGPITQQQIDASSIVYNAATKWKESDKALYQIGQALPGHDHSSVLLKSAALNQLYATRSMDIHAAAKGMQGHLKTRVSSGSDPLRACDISKTEFSNGTKLELRSFTSKYLHFFVDKDVFPIFDKYAGSALACILVTGYPITIRRGAIRLSAPTFKGFES